MENLICPKCKSSNCGIVFPEICCFSCGYSAELYDFPTSWDWWRQYSVFHTGRDPGPNEPSEEQTTINNLQERVEVLEERLSDLSPAELKELGFQLTWDAIRELRTGLRFTQRAVGESLRKRYKAPIRARSKPYRGAQIEQTENH